MKLCHHSLDDFFLKNEVAGAEDELEDFWSGAIFQGSPHKIMYDGQSLFDRENSEKFKELKSPELKKVSCTFELYPQG